MNRGFYHLTLIALLFLSIFLVEPRIIHAQFDDSVDTDQFDFIVSPPNPTPGQSVTVTATSYNLDLTRQNITWTINGKVYDKGLGKTAITTSVGVAGSVTVIKATIIDPSGNPLVKTARLTPATVDVLWQAGSYTPPFYEGKALFPNRGRVTIVAMPNLYKGSARLDSKKLIYTWSIDGAPAPEASGYGKDSMVIQGGVFARPINISVSVSNIDQSVTGTGKTTLTPQDPQIILYEESPYYGVFYNQAFQDQVKLTQDEIVVRAEPYNFSTSLPHNASLLNYDWSVNSVSVQGKTDETITLRQPGKVSGYSTVAVIVTSPTNQFQKQDQSLTINFSPVKK